MRSAVRSALGMLERLNTAVYYVIGALLAVISVVVLMQVIVRFVLTSLGVNISAPWTEELARYLLVWLIFLGAAVGCRRMQLISLEFVIKGLPRAVGSVMRHVALVLCLGLFAIVMQISMIWVYWAMPVGAALMIVNTLAFMAESWLEGRDIRQSGGLSEEA
jgi:TRAP-type C4-dicarboxylate transport system permease small subunit